MGARWLPPRGGPAASCRRGRDLGAGGARKPHPGIYARAAESLDVDPRQVLFVGDSWEPDVRGPRRHGMAAVHVWQAEERRGQCAPALEPGDHRVGELTGVLELLGL